MSNSAFNIKLYSIKELLMDAESYQIPIYQRNYAWGETEISQLIQDVIDSAKEHKSLDYYIGTLVVSTDDNNGIIKHNTIDGQQRLTTLTILTSAIKNHFKEVDTSWFSKLNLCFESREKSTHTLDAVLKGKFDNNKDDYNSSIKNAYNTCCKTLKSKLKENEIDIKAFTTFLFNSVKILRVPLPKETDLNHYFEIMNSRGEQLEKHEILKAHLMAVFNDLDDAASNTYKNYFNLIWEACSNMEKYVQYGFSVLQRDAIWGKEDWDTLQVYDFDTLIEKIKGIDSIKKTTEGLTIESILSRPPIKLNNKNTEDSPDRFNSVINFQNFLIHVLRVQVTKKHIVLDDKKLLDLFETELKSSKDNIAFVKEFIFNLLKCKFLIDKYVIKREFIGNADRWSLKKLKWYKDNKVSYVNSFGDDSTSLEINDNRKLIMLLSMFHVSTPTMVYKHWFSAVLHYLFNQYNLDSKNYIQYLEHIAKAFVYDRYLSNAGNDYYNIIFENAIVTNRELSEEKLKFHSLENNLVFNYLDYLLWCTYASKHKKVQEYEFTFRTSVEHFYPQNPIENIPKLDDEHLHLFGNLCLISHSKNSRLSNLPPVAKGSYYLNTGIDSVKQYLMMELLRNSGKWEQSEIEAHNNAMIEVLRGNTNSTYTISNKFSKGEKWFNELKISNKPLLARALLCFGDTSVNTGIILNGDKYNLYDWDYIISTEYYQMFIEFIDTTNPSSINELIDFKLNTQNLIESNDYRLAFIKHDFLIRYCLEGNFGWLNEGYEILLIDGFKKANNSKELYSFYLENFFYENFNLKCHSSYDNGFQINLNYAEGQFMIDTHSESFDAILRFKNDNGKKISYFFECDLHGKSKIFSKLDELGWVKIEAGLFQLNDMPQLMFLFDDYEENFKELEISTIKLLQNGFKIKL